MARKTVTGRNAPGTGSIRKKIVHRNGQEYTYWEARLTVGFDAGTGKQVQRSFTGKTQKEVRQRMQAAAVAINTGTYTEPSKITVGEWLDLWSADYLGGVKPFTVISYANQIRNHIKPALGAVRLEALDTNVIQRFYNSLQSGSQGKKQLPPKPSKTSTVSSIRRSSRRWPSGISASIHRMPAHFLELSEKNWLLWTRRRAWPFSAQFKGILWKICLRLPCSPACGKGRSWALCGTA